MMNTLTKLTINKKISAFFMDGTSRINLNIATVSRLLNGPEPRKVPVVVAPHARSTKLLVDLAESSGRNVVQDDQDATLLVQPESSAWSQGGSSETTSVMNMLDKIEEPPVVEPESVSWSDMTDEQRAEVIADDAVVSEPVIEPVADEAVGEPEAELPGRSLKLSNSWRQRQRPRPLNLLRRRKHQRWSRLRSRNIKPSERSFSRVHPLGSCCLFSRPGRTTR